MEYKHLKTFILKTIGITGLMAMAGLFVCSSPKEELLSPDRADYTEVRSSAQRLEDNIGQPSANLLRNANGEERLRHWDVIESKESFGGNYWIAKRGGSGASFAGRGFVTSWNWARKRQRIAIEAHPGLKNAILLGQGVTFSASEEFSRTWCGIRGSRKDEYYLTLSVLDASGNRLQTTTTGILTADSPSRQDCS